jgi:hypothetical protein
MTIYRPAQNLSVGGDLPQKILARGQKFWGSLKAENPAWGQKFQPGGRNSAPPEIFILKIPALN